MLSGIQAFLEKNRHWLFSFLLVVIIVPFVFTIGNMPGLGHGKKRSQTKMFGYDFSNKEQVEKVVRNGAISLALQTGSEENTWMESAQGYAFYRLFFIQIAKSLHLPEPNDEQLKPFIETRLLFLDEHRVFQASLYNEYLSKWTKMFGKTQNLRQILVEDYWCEQVRKVISVPGFVLPEECANMYKHWKTRYQLQYVALKNTAVPPENVSEDQLQSYFETHKNHYRVDERVEVEILFFDAKKFRASLPIVSKAELEPYFQEHKAEFLPKDAEDVTFETVEDKVRKHYNKARAKELAEQQATQFVLQVYDKNIVLDSEAWQQWISENQVRTLASLAPYSKETLPEKPGLTKEILLKAFDLDSERFLSEPMPVHNGYVAVALKQTFEPYYPSLGDVREHVLADYKKSECERLFAEKATQLSDSLNQTNVNLEELLAKNQLEIKDLPEFTLDNPVALNNLLESHNFAAFISVLEKLSVGQWSSPILSKEGEQLIFLLKNREVDTKCLEEDAFKTFEMFFNRRQSMVYLENLLHEALEKESSGIERR